MSPDAAVPLYRGHGAPPALPPGALDKDAWLARAAGRTVGDRQRLREASARLQALAGALGVPYLAGPSLKGVARSWAEQWAEDVGSDEAERIFGSERRGAPCAGQVTVLDGLPTAPVALEHDVMTTQDGEYDQDQEGRLPPADWYTSNPIPLAGVAAGQAFLFAVAPRRAGDAGPMARVLGWLRGALTAIGAGAKTAAGYGRFEALPAQAGD